MRIETSSLPGQVRIDCPKCGRLFEVPDWRDSEFGDKIAAAYEAGRICPECCEAENHARREREERERRRGNAANSGLPSGYLRDRTTGRPFPAPPVRFAAEWIWRHRYDHLLLSGPTGSGKSTSACFVADKLIADGWDIRYTTLRKLLGAWRDAKTSDQPGAQEHFLRGIFRRDVYIIDEVAGKARITDSGQELLFELLEGVNSGEGASGLWLLGNFYAGSIEDIFADPEPARRRLQENFICAVIDRKAEKITELKVWEEK